MQLRRVPLYRCLQEICWYLPAWQERGHLLRLQGSGVFLWQFGDKRVKVENWSAMGGRREWKPDPWAWSMRWSYKLLKYCQWWQLLVSLKGECVFCQRIFVISLSIINTVFIFSPFNKIVVVYVGKIVFLSYFALLDFFHLQESNTQSCLEKVWRKSIVKYCFE